MNNLSGKQLQANAEASIVLLSRSPEGHEGDNQISCFFDSSANSPQLSFEKESSSTSGTGWRQNERDDG